MGTLPLDFEQDSPPSLTYLFSTKPWLPSQRSDLSTPWPPSTPPLKRGLNWGTMGPPPPASLWPRPSLALLNSATNIVVSMLVMKILTSTLPMFSIPSSLSTMDSLETSSTPLTWIPPRSPRTLTLRSPFTLAESVLDVPSKDSVFPPESPSNNVLMLRHS